MSYQPDASLPPAMQEKFRQFHQRTGLVPNVGATAELVRDAKALAKHRPTDLSDAHLEAFAGVDVDEALMAHTDRENVSGRGEFAKEFGQDTPVTMSLLDIALSIPLKQLGRFFLRLRKLEAALRAPAVTQWPGSGSLGEQSIGAEAVEVKLGRDGSLIVPQEALVRKTSDGDATIQELRREIANTNRHVVALQLEIAELKKRPWLKDEGTWQSGRRYEPGDLVSWGGSYHLCREATSAKPAQADEGSRAWRLVVKRGSDGKQGERGPAGPPGICRCAGTHP